MTRRLLPELRRALQDELDTLQTSPGSSVVKSEAAWPWPRYVEAGVTWPPGMLTLWPQVGRQRLRLILSIPQQPSQDIKPPIPAITRNWAYYLYFGLASIDGVDETRLNKIFKIPKKFWSLCLFKFNYSAKGRLQKKKPEYLVTLSKKEGGRSGWITFKILRENVTQIGGRG